jgi:hypothetical protein
MDVVGGITRGISVSSLGIRPLTERRSLVCRRGTTIK